MSERTFLLQQQQRQPVFEGLPAAHWMHGTSTSLPPPAEKKPKKVKPRCELEMRPLPNGRMSLQVSLAVIAQVEQLLREGLSHSQIATRTGATYKTVEKVRTSLGLLVELPVLPALPKADAPELVERVRPLLLEGKSDMSAGNHLGVSRHVITRIRKSLGIASIKYVGRPITIITDQPSRIPATPVAPKIVAQLLPEITSPPPAPPPRVEPARPHHVLDWATRMSMWSFEDNYKPPRPKSHKSTKVLVHAQIRDVASRSPDAATSINSKPSQRVGRPQSIAALAEAEIFGGEK